MSGILLQGGCVLTLGAKTPNHHRADLLIEDGKVAEVGPDLRPRDAEVIDASDTIVMPGFVDTHRHVWRSLFKNLGSVAERIDTSHLEPDDVYAATLVGLLGAVEAGTTAVVDWADLPPDRTHVEAALQAHSDAGLRTVFVAGQAGGAAGDEVSAQWLAERTGQRGAEGASAFGSADLTAANLEAIADEWEAARRLGLRIHAHAGLDREDAGAVSRLAERGLLRNDVTLVHGTHLDDADLDAVSAAGASIALAPSSEMARGLGTPPLQKLLDRQIEPGLAVDDDQMAPGDMLAQMRVANSVQHADYFDLKLAGKAGLPNLLSTRDVIRYATVTAARAAGLGEVAGMLEVGRQADIVVFRTDRPNVYPINDPIGAVVWGVDSSNVDWVFVAGRAVMRNGALAADVDRARDLASAARDRVMARAGLQSETATGELR